MDAPGYLVILIVLSYGGMSTQAPQNKPATKITISGGNNNKIDTSVTIFPNCTTAKGLTGVCIDRNHCEYGTPAVDFTLFATKGYKKISPGTHSIECKQYQLHHEAVKTISIGASFWLCARCDALSMGLWELNLSCPIMQLFERLISNDNKQNTVLTNAQIISILEKEFNMDVSTLHELEVDIYLNIVKRFLKDWPQWDEFDRGINSLRKQKAHKSIKKTLENKYKDLKKYLQVQIDITKPLAKDVVNKMQLEKMKKMEKVDTSDIVLEVYCSRKQLNELVCNRPNPTLDNNIFNLADHQFNTISLSKLPLESILNWWGVQVTLEMKCISLSRTTMHQLKQTLVNENNGPRNLKQLLKPALQIKEQKRITEDVPKDKIFELFDEILIGQVNNQTDNNQMYSILNSLFNMLKSDLAMADKDLKVPATYRQHSSKYPYYRKLRKEVGPDVPSSGNLFDLCIEETIAPVHVFHIGKIGTYGKQPKHKEISLTFECGECKVKYNASDSYTIMRDHFDAYHAKEPDWVCTCCEKTFSMTELTKNKWAHSCT